VRLHDRIEDGLENQDFPLEIVRSEKEIQGLMDFLTIFQEKAKDESLKNAAAKFEAEYSKQAFCQNTLWDEMILEYYKKAEEARILSSIQKGDTAPLRDFIGTANRNNAEITRYLVENLNFQMSSENEIFLQNPQTENYITLLREKIGNPQ